MFYHIRSWRSWSIDLSVRFASVVVLDDVGCRGSWSLNFSFGPLECELVQLIFRSVMGRTSNRKSQYVTCQCGDTKGDVGDAHDETVLVVECEETESWNSRSKVEQEAKCVCRCRTAVSHYQGPVDMHFLKDKDHGRLLERCNVCKAGYPHWQG
jgi:hypothetical protein